MFSLDHNVRVFVYQVLDHQVQYLLLRQKPRAEWPFGPVVGPVNIDEHLQDAIVREVRVETGIRRPVHLMELFEPSKELFGDVGLVEWPFGYQAGTPANPIRELQPGPMIGEFVWLPFERAFRLVENPRDRDALVRLQLRLGA